MGKWLDMRSLIFETLQWKYGLLSPQNHPIFIKETKRLEAIWRKDKSKFEIEINKLTS
jgi:hypothetical protein